MVDQSQSGYLKFPKNEILHIGMVVNPVKVEYFQYQLMYLDAKFHRKSDFSIKRYLDPWSDWVTDDQSQKERLKSGG